MYSRLINLIKFWYLINNEFSILIIFKLWILKYFQLINPIIKFNKLNPKLINNKDQFCKPNKQIIQIANKVLTNNFIRLTNRKWIILFKWIWIELNSPKFVLLKKIIDLLAKLLTILLLILEKILLLILFMYIVISKSLKALLI